MSNAHYCVFVYIAWNFQKCLSHKYNDIRCCKYIADISTVDETGGQRL